MSPDWLTGTPADWMVSTSNADWMELSCDAFIETKCMKKKEYVCVKVL